MQCNCTISEVENALSKYTWAKEAQKKMEKLKEEGKPLPKSFAEVLPCNVALRILVKREVFCYM